jgi:hypothetical protein
VSDDENALSLAPRLRRFLSPPRTPYRSKRDAEDFFFHLLFLRKPSVLARVRHG